MRAKTSRIAIAIATAMVLLPLNGCATIPAGAETETEVPLPQEIDDIDSSQLVPTAEKEKCLKAPAVTSAAKHEESPLVGGGVFGTYDWAAGKTNGGQVWKTRLAYSKSNLAQVRIAPSFTQIGNVGVQEKLAAKINAVAYVNGDFFHLRGTNLLYSAMVENNFLAYSPAEPTAIVGVVENQANEHTGMQGESQIVTGKKKIATQGLNLVYLDADSIGAYNYLKTTTGLPTFSYVVTVSNNIVQTSEPATSFESPTKFGEYVFVASGAGVSKLKELKEGDWVSYEKPKDAKTTKFLRTEISPSGTVALPNGKTIPIRAINHREVVVKSGAVLFTSQLYPTTSKLSATIVTDKTGKVLSLFPEGKSINVAKDNYVLQLGVSTAPMIKALKVGDQLTIDNSYEIKKELPLFSAFGNRENLMINGVIIARCSPSHEDIRPRNAIGWNENGDVWFATTTMGVKNAADVFNRFRLGGSSVHQLASWLKELGATQAIMLDGGGSTTMYAQTPSSGYERVDLPATEWVRSVPQGIGMVSR